jgi:hypothetical protein
MKCTHFVPALLILLVAAVSVGASWAQDEMEPRSMDTNVQITLAVGDVDEPKPERTYRIVGRSGNRTHRLLSGWRMPIPTETDADDEDGPVTSFVYQNVGVTANLRVSVPSKDRIFLSGQVELSGANESMDAAKSAQMPVIGTFQQELEVVLKDGRPVKVAEVTDPEGRSLFLQIQVDVLD